MYEVERLRVYAFLLKCVEESGVVYQWESRFDVSKKASYNFTLRPLSLNPGDKVCERLQARAVGPPPVVALVEEVNVFGLCREVEREELLEEFPSLFSRAIGLYANACV